MATLEELQAELARRSGGGGAPPPAAPADDGAERDQLIQQFLQARERAAGGGAAAAAPPAAPVEPAPTPATPSTRLQDRLSAFERGDPVLGVSAGERATQALVGQGVRTDLAMSPDERYRAGLGIEEVDAHQRVLRQRPGMAGATVARDPASGHLIGTAPTGDRFFVNRPGADLGDIAGAVPDIGVAAYGATAGALTGLAFGAATASPMVGVTAAAIAEAVASSAQRFDVYRRGQQAGSVDPALDPLTLWQHTLPEAALNGLMSFGVGTAYRVFRAVAGRHAPELTIEEFERRLAQARGETAPAGVEPTSAQALAGTPAGDILAEHQRRIAGGSGPTAVELRARLDAQARGVVQAEQRTADTALPGVDREAMTPRVAGGAIRDQVRQEHDDLLGRVRAAANGVITGAEDQATTGATLRGAFDRAQTRLGENADAAFDAIRNEVGDVEGVPAATIAFARARAGGLDAQVVPNLNAAERRFVNGILERNAPEGEAARAVSYGQVSDDIAEINRLIRRVSRGQGTGEAHPEVETLNGLRDALMRDREGILRAAGRDDALAQLQQVSAWYRDENNRLTRGVIEEITRTRAGGSYDVIPEEQVARRLLRSRADSQLVAELAADPHYTQQLAPVMDAMRAALRDEWRQAAVDPASRLVNQQGHARFMEQNGQRLGLFFDPAEAAQFAQPAALAARLDRQEQVWRQLIGGLETEPGSGRMLADLAPTPDGVFRHVWGASPDPGIVRAVTGALTQSGNTEALNAFRGAILRDVRENVLQGAGQSGTGRATLDPAALSAYVRTHAEALTEALGRDYVTGLRQVATAAERFAMGSRPASEDTRRGLIFWLARIQFAPFSTAGRIMTGTMRVGETANTSALGRLLLDPEAMRRAVQARNLTSREAVDWAIAGGLIGDAVEANR